jgi:hypothetical protein
MEKHPRDMCLRLHGFICDLDLVHCLDVISISIMTAKKNVDIIRTGNRGLVNAMNCGGRVSLNPDDSDMMEPLFISVDH